MAPPSRGYFYSTGYQVVDVERSCAIGILYAVEDHPFPREANCKLGRGRPLTRVAQEPGASLAVQYHAASNDAGGTTVCTAVDLPLVRAAEWANNRSHDCEYHAAINDAGSEQSWLCAESRFERGIGRATVLLYISRN